MRSCISKRQACRGPRRGRRSMTGVEVKCGRAPRALLSWGLTLQLTGTQLNSGMLTRAACVRETDRQRRRRLPWQRARREQLMNSESLALKMAGSELWNCRRGVRI